LVSVSKKLLQY